MPFFQCLQTLELNVQSRIQNHEEGQLQTLADYILLTPGFAPCLRRLGIKLLKQNPTFGPLLPLFLEGRPPGLTHLALMGVHKRTLEEFYAAGGLAKVKILDIASFHHDIDATAAWMEGVLASEHKGAALKELHVSRCAGMPIIACM